MRFGACVRPLDALLGSLRGCLDRFPDKRRGLNTTYAMGNIGKAAFSVFFLQSPSFLAHQRQFEAGHGHSTCSNLLGIAKIPSDNHIRDMLDSAAPALLHPVFAAALDQIRQIDGALEAFRRLDGCVLIALDGTEYHCSRKIHCPQCSTRLRGKGETEYYHSLLAATLVAPGHDKVIPLVLAFITRRMGRRSRTARPLPPSAGCGDDLFSRQPLCQAVLEAGGHFIFVCKPSSHPLIQEYLSGIDLPMVEQTLRRGKQRFVHRYRWLPEAWCEQHEQRYRPVMEWLRSSLILSS